MSSASSTGLLSAVDYQDFDQMATVAASAWDQRYRKLGKGPEYGFARQLNLPSTQLSHIGWKNGIHIETGTPRDCVGIVQQVAGNKRLRMNGQTLPENRIALLHSPREYDLVNADGTTYIVLAVDLERLGRHVETHWGRLPARLDSLSTLISDSGTQQKHLAALLRQHLDQSYDNPQLLTDPTIREIVIDELLDAVLLSSRAPTTQRIPARRHLFAKKASEYIKDNLDEGSRMGKA